MGVICSFLTAGLLVGGCERVVQRSYAGTDRIESIPMRANEELRAVTRGCSLTLTGKFLRLRLEGRDTFVRIDDPVGTVYVDGDSHSVECHFPPRRLVLRGQGHRVVIWDRPGQARPDTDVQGTDQLVQFRKPE
jgi:hypothetical protein